jgi:hypothetical protein
MGIDIHIDSLYRDSKLSKADTLNVYKCRFREAVAGGSTVSCGKGEIVLHGKRDAITSVDYKLDVYRYLAIKKVMVVKSKAGALDTAYTFKIDTIGNLKKDSVLARITGYCDFFDTFEPQASETSTTKIYKGASGDEIVFFKINWKSSPKIWIWIVNFEGD